MFWLIGRRTAPPPRPQPSVVSPDEAAIALVEGQAGVASSTGAVVLPTPAERRGAYRLVFVPVAPGEPARPPFKLRLVGPGGGDLWVSIWREAGEHRGMLELVLPAAGLATGRYALHVQDAGGRVRHYPFIVP